MKNLTFSDLGFEGVPNIAPIRTDYVSKIIMPVYVSKDTEPVYKRFLIPALMKYLQHAELRHEEVGFVAAIAFFVDGSVQYAYHDSTGHLDIVRGGVYEPDHYKNKGELGKFSNNLDFIRETIRENRPEGLMLFQETPWREDKYRLRVIHNTSDDTVVIADEEEKLSEEDDKRFALMRSCYENLKIYSEKEELTAIEQEEVTAMLNLIDVMKASD